LYGLSGDSCKGEYKNGKNLFFSVLPSTSNKKIFQIWRGSVGISEDVTEIQLVVNKQFHCCGGWKTELTPLYVSVLRISLMFGGTQITKRIQSRG